MTPEYLIAEILRGYQHGDRDACLRAIDAYERGCATVVRLAAVATAAHACLEANRYGTNDWEAWRVLREALDALEKS